MSRQEVIGVRAIGDDNFTCLQGRAARYPENYSGKQATWPTCLTEHARYITIQLAVVAVPRALFAQILARIARLACRSEPNQ